MHAVISFMGNNDHGILARQCWNSPWPRHAGIDADVNNSGLEVRTGRAREVLVSRSARRIGVFTKTLTQHQNWAGGARFSLPVIWVPVSLLTNYTWEMDSTLLEAT